MSISLKKKVIPVLGLMLLLLCTGCSDAVWDEMKEEGKELLEQSDEMNKELVAEANEVNTNVILNNVKTAKGWASLFEKENLRIQYVLSDKPDEKNTIENTEEFVEQMAVEQWKLTDEFPSDTQTEILFFIQEPISDGLDDSQYKNIANLRYFPEENYVTLTIGEWLVDSSENFDLEKTSLSSVYQVPDTVIDVLQNIK